MYKNIFIYLALATAIDGCRGGIRIKRIAESIKNDEKKLAGAALGTIGGDSSSKAASGGLEAPLEGHGLNTKRDVLDGDAMQRFAEDFKHHPRMSRELEKVNVEDHRGVRDSKGGSDSKLNKEKEEITVNDDVRIIEKGSRDLNGDMSSRKLLNHQHTEQNERVVRVPIERKSTLGLAATDVKRHNDERSRHEHSNIQEQAALQLRKAAKRDGKNLDKTGPKILTTSGLNSAVSENHHASRTSNSEGDTIKKLIEDVKLEGHKKELKPDVDVYLYSNMPSFYKAPPVLLEMYNTKESMSPASFEHYYPPYKWLQRRSPIQSAFEIANMMVKVGMDELESEDYGEHGPFIFDSLAKGPHKFERGFSAEASFCPVHAKKASLTGELTELAEGGPRFGECLCSFGRSARDVSSKVEDTEKVKRAEGNDHEEGLHKREHLGARPLALLKSF